MARSALIFSRQNTPTFEPDGIIEGVARGAYIISEADGEPQAIIMGTGTELAIALKAQELLKADGIAARVVSMPSFELFRAQDAAYQHSVLPPKLTARVAIEAGNQQSWHEWLGLDGHFIGVVGRFGASAPYRKSTRSWA